MTDSAEIAYRSTADIKERLLQTDDQKEISNSLSQLCCIYFENENSLIAFVDCDLIQKVVDVIKGHRRSDLEGRDILYNAMSYLIIILLQATAIRDADAFDIIEYIIEEPGFAEKLVDQLDWLHHDPKCRVVKLTLQLINTLLMAHAIDEKSGIASRLRLAGLFRRIPCLASAPVAAYCRDQLNDFYHLIHLSIYQSRKTHADPSQSFAQRSLFQSIKKEIIKYVGAKDVQAEEPNWNLEGLIEPSEVYGHHGGDSADMNLLEQDLNPDPLNILNNQCGWLGLQDLYDLLCYDHQYLLKQFVEHVAFVQPKSRISLVRVSMVVTNMIYETFKMGEGAKSLQDRRSFKLLPVEHIEAARGTVLDNRPGDPPESPVKASDDPNVTHRLFDWTPIHFYTVLNFIRLWTASSACPSDFDNVAKVVKLLLSKALENAEAPIEDVIHILENTSYEQLREEQLCAVEADIYNRWKEPIDELRRQFYAEAADFVREQRIRLLLAGDWFRCQLPEQEHAKSQAGGRGTAAYRASYGSSHSNNGLINGSGNMSAIKKKRSSTENDYRGMESNFSLGTKLSDNQDEILITSKAPARTVYYYYIALSPSRQTLHYRKTDSDNMRNAQLDVKNINDSIELSSVSEVSCYIPPKPPKVSGRVQLKGKINFSRISLLSANQNAKGKAIELLSFCPDTEEKAAAWIDGLRLLKDPNAELTAQSQDYIDTFVDTKLKLQLLNFGPEDYFKIPRTDTSDINQSMLSNDYYYQ